MKNIFKIIAAILAVAATLFTCACGAKPEVETTTKAPETTAAIETTKASVNEGLTDEIKKEYLEIIKDYEKNYGIYTETTDKYDTKGYTGVYFCELFDWNVDGSPELMIGYSKDFTIWYNIEYISVYGIENGEVRQLLAEKYNHTHLSLDGSQGIMFAKGNDGLVRLVLANDEAEEWNTSGVDYVSYSDGKIERTSLNAYGFSDEEREDEDYFDRYTVDGKEVSFAEYDAKEKELGEVFEVALVNNMPYDNLVKFLSGESDSYINEFFSSFDFDDEKHADWVYETEFGYKMTF